MTIDRRTCIAYWLLCWGFDSWKTSLSTLINSSCLLQSAVPHFPDRRRSLLPQVSGLSMWWLDGLLLVLRYWAPWSSLHWSSILIGCKLCWGHPASAVTPSWSLQQGSGRLHTGYSGCRWPSGSCFYMRNPPLVVYSTCRPPPVISTASLKILSIKQLNRRGDSKQPCLTPVYLKSSDVPSAVLTQHHVPVYSSLMMSNQLLGNPVVPQDG